MGKYLIIFAALLISALSFEQSEGKVLRQANENVIVLGDEKFQLASNLTLQGFKPECGTEADLFRCCIVFESTINIKACVSLEYLEDEYGVEMNVTLNGLTLITEKISAKNPPPICYHIPYLESIAEVCFRMHDLEIKNKHLDGCVNLEAHISYLKVWKFHVGCFTIPVGFIDKNKMNKLNFLINEDNYDNDQVEMNGH